MDETTAATTPSPRWRPPRFWRLVLGLARVVLPLVCRLRVTGDVPDEHRDGPLILAGNHIGTFDPVIFAAAAAGRHLAPRMMATGGVFRAPIVGPLMRAAGHIPVDRGRPTVANAIPDAVEAVRAGSVIFIYPEGRIGLDPGMWPERAKSGLARLALATRAPVVPVATWGSHEVVAYHGMANMIRTVITAFWRRPVVRIHFGAPVDLSDLREGVTGDAQRASDRVMDAITADLVRLRSGLDGGRAELRLPRYRDPTRPISTARVHRPRRAAASTRTAEARSAPAVGRTAAVNRTAADSR
jgi:1-acyl-sn-glycerol-3-phosphate acyltransferase